MRLFALVLPLLFCTAAAAQTAADAAAFQGVDEAVETGMPDVQSLVVMLHGRTVHRWFRDAKPDALRDTQSVGKSALAALVGTALQRGQIASLDQPVVELMPQWRALNADPRAQAITLRHLLGMTAGFEVNDAGGTAAPLRPEAGWARPLRAAPGAVFAYDNSIVNMVTAVLEKAGGRPLPDLAREQLVQPMGMAEPDYRRTLQLRTEDMARLGQLFLQDGVWEGRPLLAPGFAAAATKRQSAGGPPVGVPYGHFWWAAPVDVPRPPFFASGYAGQFIWVNPALGWVAAVTSTVSQGSQQRGQAFKLIHGPVTAAVHKRLAAPQ